MTCPLKPGLRCRAGPSEVYGTPCPGCTVGPRFDRSRRPRRDPGNGPNPAAILTPQFTPQIHPGEFEGLARSRIHPPNSPPSVSPGELAEVAP